MTLRLDGAGLIHPNGFEALRPSSLVVGCGERVAVIGPSGAGKTSLIRLIATSIRPTCGSLSVLGCDPWMIPGQKLRRLRARIGVIHQVPPIPGRLRVVTAVLAGKLGEWSLAKSTLSLIYPGDIAGARSALARVDLEDRLFDRFDRLSGGQMQRVGVARTLYQAPELILADEPVSSLDPALADMTVQELVTDAIDRRATLIASLHAVDLALKWFPRVIGLKAGTVAFDLRAGNVTKAMLRELYLSEGAALPVQMPGEPEIDLWPRAMASPEVKRPLCS